MSTFFPPDPTESDPPPTPAPARPRRRFRWLRRAVAVLAVSVVVLGAATAFYVHSVSRSFSTNVHREQLLPTEPIPEESAGEDPSSGGSASPGQSRPTSKAAQTGTNYVLMGSDSRDPNDPSAGRSDSLIVLHLAADRQHAYLISFPRDLWVDVPGRGMAKINAAYAWGGPRLTVQTLEQLLDTRMDHVAIIDFEGFIGLTEQLGGVRVWNAHASIMGPYTYPQGWITIKGEEALLYVRQRHELPNGDLDRAERQRAVVKAILQKGLSAGMIADPVKFTRFIGLVGSHITIDDQLTDSAIRSTALSLRLSTNDIESLQAPISGFGTIGGQSVDIVDRFRMNELAAAIRHDTLDRYSTQ